LGGACESKATVEPRAAAQGGQPLLPRHRRQAMPQQEIPVIIAGGGIE